MLSDFTDINTWFIRKRKHAHLDAFFKLTSRNIQAKHTLNLRVPRISKRRMLVRVALHNRLRRIMSPLPSHAQLSLNFLDDSVQGHGTVAPPAAQALSSNPSPIVALAVSHSRLHPVAQKEPEG